MNIANIIDSITDDIGSMIAVWRGTPAAMSGQTQAQVAVAQAQIQAASQQQLYLMLGLGALAVFVLSRK